MLTEAVPIKIFLDQAFTRIEIKPHIDSIRLDVADLQVILTGHFNDMGIYSVTPEMAPALLKVIPKYLANSPEILRKTRELAIREARLRRTKGKSDL
ncbi:MAG: hypothetical protein HRU19_28220 [Pseudobacteriovorax sp.]|nr:hypothetical protein [Pseudobacteriovorax sp.]